MFLLLYFQKQSQENLKNNQTQFAKCQTHQTIQEDILACHGALTIWTLTSDITLKQRESLYKRVLTIFATKPISYHHSFILKTYVLFNYENQKYFKFACTINKILHGLAPGPLREYMQQKSSAGAPTKSAVKGDCVFWTIYSTLCVKGCNI